jgi:hypothetical protein
MTRKTGSAMPLVPALRLVCAARHPVLRSGLAEDRDVHAAFFRPELADVLQQK